MLLVLGFIALTIVVLSGFGAALSGGRQQSDRSFFDLAILGLLLVSAIGLVANFFLPLTPYLVVATAAVGLICFAFHRKQLWRSLGRRPVTVLAVLAAILAMDGVGVLITPLSYDTGLYHLQLIEWLEHSPKIFGLVNLHSRFGVNSIWFLVVSMFDFVRAGHEGIFLVNAALFTAVIGALIHPILDGAPREPAAPVTNSGIANLYAVIVAGVLLADAATIMFNQLFAGPENDLPAALLVIYAFCVFLRIFEADGDRRSRLLQLLVVSVMAVMIKITTAPVLLLLPVAAYAVTGSDRSRMVQLVREPVLTCLFVVGIAWMAGGLISSGCIAFPVASSCIAALPWTPPIADIHQFAALVTAWARSPNEHFQEAATGWAWLRDWPSMMLAHRVFIPVAGWSFAIAAGIGIGIALVDRYIFKAKRPDRAGGAGMGMIGYATLTACLGNLFWFLAAPDPRFGIGFLLALPALGVAAGTQALSVDGPAIRFVVGRCALVVFVFVCAGLFVKDLRMVAFSAAKTWPSIPYVPVAAQDFGPSFRVNVPIAGNQCWDAPRPCAPGRGPAAVPLSEHKLLLWHFIEPASAAPALE
jgi:hypothetical protein